jgi:hypothetical protein
MAQAANHKVHGKAATITFTPPVGGSATTIQFRKWSGEVERRMADTTDSFNYDSTSDMVWNSQIPAGNSVKVTIEGVVDFGIFQTIIVPAICTSQVPAAVVLGITSAIIFGHGNFDLSNLKVELSTNEDDPITFTFDAMSNGVVTFGA